MMAESLRQTLGEMAGDGFVKGMRMKGFELRRFSAGATPTLTPTPTQPPTLTLTSATRARRRPPPTAPPRS